MDEQFPSDTLAKQFIAELPELVCLYQNQQEMYGVFDTIFFSTQLAKVVRLLYRRTLDKRSAVVAKEMLKRILDFIERCAASDDYYMLNVIATGFLESLDILGQDYQVICAMFGPKTIELLRPIEKALNMQTDLGINASKKGYRYVHECIDQIFEPKKK